jgi:hypothetical protein
MSDEGVIAHARRWALSWSKNRRVPIYLLARAIAPVCPLAPTPRNNKSAR